MYMCGSPGWKLNIILLHISTALSNTATEGFIEGGAHTHYVLSGVHASTTVHEPQP